MSEKREMTVTLKGGKEFSAPWIVAGGMPNEIRDQIVLAFGFDAGAVEGLSLAELTVEASRVFQGLVNVQQQAGGKVLAKGTGKAKAEPEKVEQLNEPSSAPQAAEEPKAEATPQPEPETPAQAQEDPLLKAIAEAADLAAITTLWKANNAAFKTRKDVAEAVTKRRAEIGA